jgi:phosphoserine aminotransferase
VDLFYKHNYKDQYNSLIFTHENYKKRQTTHTPNVLNIYLLYRVLQDLDHIKHITTKTLARSQRYYDFFDNHPFLVPYVRNKVNRSDTVIAVTASPPVIKKVREEAERAGIFLGEGYEYLKDKTFRIANFPAISDEAMDTLLGFLAEVKR